MLRRFLIASIALLGLLAASDPAEAQFGYGYPRGYGAYGWGGWGGNQNVLGGYMSGLGSFARGQGAYEVDDAKARAINTDTMLKWNQALRARQRELRAEQAKEEAVEEVQREQRLEQLRLKEGTTLNNLLLEILDTDPSALKSTAAKTPLTADAIREIPFEWDSEAITICIDQMTAQDSLPPALMGEEYIPERNAVRDAVEAALKEDQKGDVSPAARDRLDKAIAALRDKFSKNVSDLDPGYITGNNYINTLASLTRLLNDPTMKKMLGELDSAKSYTIGDLIGFMNAFNLRFGPAESDRQVQLYAALVPQFEQILQGLGVSPAGTSTVPNDQQLREAAQNVFHGIQWDQLQAHARSR